MANIFDYMNWRDISLEKVEFNEVDNLILSRLSYFPFDGIISKDEEITINEAYKRTKILGTTGRTLQVEDIELYQILAKSKRFGKCKITNFVNKIEPELEKQFAAITIILPELFMCKMQRFFRYVLREISVCQSAAARRNRRPASEPADSRHKVVAQNRNFQFSHVCKHTAIVFDILITPGKSEFDPCHIKFIAFERLKPETGIGEPVPDRFQRLELIHGSHSGQFRRSFRNRILNSRLTGKFPFDLRFRRKKDPKFHFFAPMDFRIRSVPICLPHLLRTSVSSLPPLVFRPW